MFELCLTGYCLPIDDNLCPFCWLNKHLGACVLDDRVLVLNSVNSTRENTSTSYQTINVYAK